MMTSILAIFALVISYYYLDKPLVLYFHALGSRRYRVLDYMQKFPEGFKILLPLAALWAAVSLGHKDTLNSG